MSNAKNNSRDKKKATNQVISNPNEGNDEKLSDDDSPIGEKETDQIRETGSVITSGGHYVHCLDRKSVV